MRLLALLVVFVCVSCNQERINQKADSFNDASYSYHYISLDTTMMYANEALKVSEHYHDGRVEALNNLAFVDLIKMHYTDAEQKLQEILSSTDNQFERLVANIQMMRLCQRESRNKEFYDYYWQAKDNINRIEEDAKMLTSRQQKRLTYAKTEMQIILAAYLYYVGQIEPSTAAVLEINQYGEIQRDTAQLLNYYYNVGSGNVLTAESPEKVAIKEFDYLIGCYMLARSSRNIYWEAEALQAMSEHLQDDYHLPILVKENAAVMKYLNIDEVNDTLLAGNFAQRSVNLFAEYGDAYQTAGALRTLSDCYFGIHDYGYAISCLNEALERDSLINQAPALTSSIREKLSINYSAIDDKQGSDFNRNLYLDLQEDTRQDRELEARADQLNKISFQQNLMIIGVCVAIALMVILLFVFTRMRRRDMEKYTVDSLLAPLEKWKQNEMEITDEIAEKHEDIIEEQKTAELLLERNFQQNMEQRAKMALVNSITPFIDRMLAEIQCLMTRSENEDVVESRYSYILELTDKINEYNDILTNWIQLRKGELSLKIESFKLNDIFDIARKGRLSFSMKGIDLVVEDTKAVVKADKTLTLFMINTIADNARKVTGEGGAVKISAVETPDYVEVEIADTGVGMTEEELQNVFNHQPTVVQNADETADLSANGLRVAEPQHGFGLMNCKGIIEKYKKVSQVFSVCSISATSEKGKGTAFRFRLPHGVVRLIIFMVGLFSSMNMSGQTVEDKIQMYVDSAYFCNLQGRYESTLAFADSARTYLNIYYKKLRPNGRDLMVMNGSSADNAAELRWLSDSLRVNYSGILDVRNETAIAALALHKWDLYNYNNKVSSRLFREYSADPTLLGYVGQMRQSSETKYVALILLSLIFLSILPAYYLLYYRYRVYHRFLVEKLGAINNVLFDQIPEEEKLENIKSLWYQSNRYISDKKGTAALTGVVDQICLALEDNINIRRLSNEQIELAEDELRRLNFEIDRLHINNNVLDNCFSTLKHETMYYPSRIRQLVETAERNITALNEITLYYKELYTILSLQAQHQVESNVRIDNYLVSYLMSLLRKLGENKNLVISKQEQPSQYVVYTVEMPNLKLTDEQIIDLFTPLTTRIPCLVIRQIIREIGETTNQRGCGVLATRREDGGANIVMTLSKKVKINI